MYQATGLCGPQWNSNQNGGSARRTLRYWAVTCIIMGIAYNEYQRTPKHCCSRRIRGELAEYLVFSTRLNDSYVSGRATGQSRVISCDVWLVVTMPDRPTYSPHLRLVLPVGLLGGQKKKKTRKQQILRLPGSLHILSGAFKHSVEVELRPRSTREDILTGIALDELAQGENLPRSHLNSPLVQQDGMRCRYRRNFPMVTSGLHAGMVIFLGTANVPRRAYKRGQGFLWGATAIPF